MCDLDESRTQIFSETFQIFSSLTESCARAMFPRAKRRRRAAPARINTTSANAAGQEIFATVEIER